MFTLSFEHSSSKNYLKAVELGIELGGNMVDGVMQINLLDYELLHSYELIYPLLEIVQNWKGLKASYNGKQVPPMRFLFGIWEQVGGCAQQRNNTCDDRYCWHDIDNWGWGCKQLNSFSAFNYGSGMYARSNRFWYNFGEFTPERTWRINKGLILEKLDKEAETKSLHICPFFDQERVRAIVESLSDMVPVDGVTYILYRNVENIPVNIRHLPKVEPENNIMREIPRISAN